MNIEMKIKAPPFDAEIFKRLEGEDAFFQFIEEQYAYTAKREAGLGPMICKPRLQDAFHSWQGDILRVRKEIKSTPDHFKQCGILVYWLRRCIPVEGFNLTDEYYPVEYKREVRETRRAFYAHYSNEYLAFSLGFRICQFFETKKSEHPKQEIKPSKDYVNMMCSFLKRKHVSPHSLILIYRSLFQAF